MSSVIPLPDEPISYCRRFSLAEILSVTNNFSDDLVIGKGGFGKVYRGSIDNGVTDVAIKRLNAESKQGAQEFWTEINTLSKLRYTHLVTLIGFSDDENEMILVYEYITNGTLAEHLYRSSSRKEDGDRNHLTWKQRLNICIDAAYGLDYLHKNSIIHRDVKSTNILLNEYCRAKIADFGLSKMTHMQSHVSTDVKGTFGYLDPEYFFSHRLTIKSDVYAFGVVLLEVLCARPPVDTSFEEVERRSLALWAQKYFKKGRLLDMIDSSLREQVSPKGLKMFSKIAIDCLHKDSKRRSTMAEVLKSLKLVSDSEKDASPHKGKVVVANLDDVFRHFNMEEVRAATKNFNEDQIIGNGEFSIVYKGLIDGGTREVAIKRWRTRISQTQINHIKKEMEVQSKLHVLNFACLIGHYIDEHEAMLVYNYIANKSLHYHLYKTKSSALSWGKRFEICLGIARALQYLRSNWPYTNWYIYLTNILLDQNWNAKMSTFKYPELTHNEIFELESASETEYNVNQSFSEKSDIYSFGVILIELLCGRTAMIGFCVDEIDKIDQEDSSSTMGGPIFQENLVHYFKSRIGSWLNIENLNTDPYVYRPMAPECFKAYIGIALDCVSNKSVNRPTMEVVISSLERASHLQKTWLEQNHIDNLPDEYSRYSDGAMSIERGKEVLKKLSEMTFKDEL